MRLSITRLRWILLAAAVLLVTVVSAFIVAGRYRAMQIYRDLIQHSGATISHDTNGFTYSQTEKGRTVFTLHAAKATQVSEGNWTLHGVAVTLYGRMANRVDHIYGNEFSYDEKAGLVRAIGEVHMDLQAPQSLTSAGRTPAAGNNLVPLSELQSAAHDAATDVIHVRTSGLVYIRSLGVAATDQPVEFRYGGVRCTSQGAEFNSSQSTLRLLAKVVAEGNVRGQPMHLTAARADVDRTANIATLEDAFVRSPGTDGQPDRTARADHTVLDLRPDGSISSARATGAVTMEGGTRQLTTAQLDATFTPQTVVHTARFSGGVLLVDTDPLRPTRGQADVADILFDAKGAPTSLVATGSQVRPSLHVLDKRQLPRGLARSLQGDRITALFTPAPKHGSGGSRAQLAEVQVSGGSQARSETLEAPRPAPVKLAGPAIKTTTLTADDLRVTFAPDASRQPQPHELFAVGHTLLQQDAPLGEQETSAGDALTGTFTQAAASSRPGSRAGLALATAVQSGHVVIHRLAPLAPGAPKQQVADATADRASFDGATQKLTLTGQARLAQDNTLLQANTVVLDQRTQDADASGNLEATFQSAQTAPAPAKPQPFTHILAATAHLVHETRQSEFRGTDAQPARLWQDGSQVQAAVLQFDDVRRTFAARAASPNTRIHAVFAGAGTPQPAGASQVHSNILRVASQKMDYSDTLREAVFTGTDGVEIDGAPGSVRAQRATAYLLPAAPGAKSAAGPNPVNGSLDRVVITGDVQLDQPGRHGTGEKLVYTAATGNSVLTGTPSSPPHIVDAQQGSITGAALLFGDAGSTIIVSGVSADMQHAGSKPGRVHTETELQSGREMRQ